MKNKYFLFLIPIIFLSSCGFIFPLYTEKDIYTDAKLEGQWKDAEMHRRPNDPKRDSLLAAIDTTYPWTIESFEGNKYKVIERTSNRFEVYYVSFAKIGGHLFIDMQMCTGDSTYFCAHKTQDHELGKVTIKGDTMVINLLNDDYIEKQVQSGKMKLKHYYTKGHYMSDGQADPPSLMIEEPTAGVQKLLLQLYDNKAAFMEDMVYVRKKN